MGNQPKTICQIRKSGERATMDDSLILTECRPRRHKDLWIDIMNEAPNERTEMIPWTGKDEPPFEVETPRTGKE